MITLISQMVGCLLIAAGIGVAVGWLLRGLPKNSPEQPYEDIANLLRTKEQALETTSHDLKVKTSAMQILEQKIMSSETRYSSIQRELTARIERVNALEAEVASRSKRLADLEAEGIAARQRVTEVNAIAAAQADDLREAQQACRAADQAREVMEQEIRVLREHIAQLNEGLADRDRLRAQVTKLESAQDRVHQLEVELSDREASHRGTIQQLERSIAERDRRIEELVPITHLLREKESELKGWEKTYARTIQEHEVEVAKLQDQCAAQEQLRAQHLLDEQHLHERDEQIAGLDRQLHNLQAERQDLLRTVQCIPGKDEHIDRLRKRLREIQSELRAKTASATATSRPTRQNGAELSSQGGPPKVSKDIQADDLKKINGIGPAFAHTLNKMGTRTFIQIARWKPEDIQKIAKKLDTDPERIKRDNWIAAAKKQHYRKYGERL
jgi:predicted flap endonuclease-1-like 5' DNA nuclease/predicted  nucleic acid-binding Zn-ribbon protein